MSSLPYLHLAGHVTKCGAFLTVVTNSILIHFTCNHVMNITTEYKCLILLMASLGIVFNMIEIVLHPFMHSYNASFIYFSVTLASRNHAVGVALLTLYALNYMLIICCLAIQFIYRSFVVLSPKYLKLFQGAGISVWILYATVCSVIWMAAMWQVLPDYYSKRYLSQDFTVNYDVDIEFVPSFQIIAYDQNNSLRFQNLMGIFGLASVLVAQYIVMIYCGFKIHHGITSKAEVTSPKIHRLQQQLFKTLLLQLTVPSIFYNTPNFLMYIVPYFNLQLSFPSGVMVCSFSLYPALDSLILMFMVAEYYRVIQKKFLRLIDNLLRCVKKGSVRRDIAEVTSRGAEWTVDT